MEKKYISSFFLLFMFLVIFAVSGGLSNVYAYTISLISTPLSVHSSNLAGWWTPIVQYNGSTYVGYLDTNLNAVVARRDSAGVWTSAIVASGIINDPGHTQVSLAVDGDGYIHVFYGMHQNSMKYRRSNTSDSVTGGFTNRAGEFPNGGNGSFTYPSLTTTPNGDVYMMIRNGSSDGAGELYRWNNVSNTWSKIAQFAKERKYTVYPDNLIADASGNIHIVWEWRKGGPGANRHAGTYAVYKPSLNKFYKIDGTQYTLPITTTTANKFQPLETGELWTEEGVQSAKVALDSVGSPIIAYAYSPLGTTTDYEFRFAKWNGSNWVRSTVTDEIDPVSKMWITYSDNKIRYYGSKNDLDAYLWTSIDEGASWSEERITSGLNVPRPVGFTSGGIDYIYLSSWATNSFYLAIVDPVAVPDTEAPTVPGNVSATSVSSSQINLTWDASTDNVSVAGYRIYRDSVEVGTTSTTSYSDGGLQPSTTYSYTVQAYDGAQNHSTSSEAASTTTLVAPSFIFSDDFEDGDSLGWTVSSGTWNVVADDTQVFKQTDTSGESLVFAGDPLWTDYSVQAKIKLYNLALNSASGILARATNATNFYHLRLHQSGMVQLYKNLNGTMTLLQESLQPVVVGTTYELKLTFAGSTITGYVDGIQKISVNDTSHTVGKVGARSYGQSMSIDEVVVTE